MRLPSCAALPVAAFLLGLAVVMVSDRAQAADWGADSFVFDTAEQGAALLGAEDEYSRRMSPLDVAAHLKTDQAVAAEDYLRFAAAQAEPWSDHNKEAIGDMLASFTAVLNALPVPFTTRVSLIRTTGAEEADASYTRGDAIILSDATLSDRLGLRWVVAHELFHVVSRQNPALRDALYAALGFVKGPAMALPPSVAAHILANPDTADDNHFIRVRHAGQAVCAVPLLLYTIDRYDPKRGGPFFNYSQLRFAVTGQVPADGVVPSDFALVPPDQLTGLYEQMGRNTDYEIIHPDEILAENFALLLTDGSAKSPEVLERMRAAFAHPAVPAERATSCG